MRRIEQAQALKEREIRLREQILDNEARHTKAKGRADQQKENEVAVAERLEAENTRRQVGYIFSH